MKQPFALFLALVLAVSCAACGGKESPPSQEVSAPSAPASTSGQPAPAPAPSGSSQPEPLPHSREPEPPAEEPAPADGSDWEQIEASYYYPAEKRENRTILDPDGLLPEGGTVSPTELIETFSTGADGKEACLAMMERLRAGEKLGNFLQSRGELYAIVRDAAGKEVGDALVKADSLEVIAYGAFPETPGGYSFRRDCALTEELKAQLEQSGLDLGKTTLTFCIIDYFSNGALFSDGEKECYIATSISFSNKRAMETDTGTQILYPVEELPALMERCMGEMFPPTVPAEDGTVYLDGGSASVPLGMNEFPPVDALCDYLEKNLTEEQYSAISYQRGKHDLTVRVIVPDTAPVEALLAGYPGRMVPIEYWVVPYSKAQLVRAQADINAFLEQHPDIAHYPVGRFVNVVPVSLKQQSPLLDEFVENYPVKGIFQVSVYPDGLPENPD